MPVNITNPNMVALDALYGAGGYDKPTAMASMMGAGICEGTASTLWYLHHAWRDQNTKLVRIKNMQRHVLAVKIAQAQGRKARDVYREWGEAMKSDTGTKKYRATMVDAGVEETF